MTAADYALLKSVSRSFYLSMRFLPTEMREPIAVGYLLARFTDTVADAPGLPVARRLDVLDAARRAVRDEDPATDIDVSDFVEKSSRPGERELLRRFPDLLRWFLSLVDADREPLREVLLTIVHGQQWDVEYFDPDRFTACETGDDLLRYTYRVAGCVGEFWTKIGFANLGERFAPPDRATDMLIGGRKLGQALQLINVLRDLHEDLPQGRCYLPAEDLRAAGWDGSAAPTTGELEPVFAKWLATCRRLLGESEGYAGDVRHRRVRFCTRLPKLLAEKTADRLALAGVERVVREKIKVPRSEVWKAVGRAGLFRA
ncbi:MAG: phytoene/squalene synthase family protein [Verrucomicrobiales bacterium]